jgi:ATP-dependent DNA helicase RecG
LKAVAATGLFAIPEIFVPIISRGDLLEGGDEARDISVEALGRQMNVVGGPSEASMPKNVGLLFFNEHPERFFPATQIDVVWFPEGAGGDRFDEKTFAGSLGRITRDALSFIHANYLKQTVIKHPDRAEAGRLWNFPYAAIEEAVVNAVYHRSYEIREPIEVRITPQELVVLSFPGPDRSIRLEDLKQGKAVSRRYRNRRIGEFLKELDLTEGRSTGTPIDKTERVFGDYIDKYTMRQSIEDGVTLEIVYSPKNNLECERWDLDYQYLFM